MNGFVTTLNKVSIVVFWLSFCSLCFAQAEKETQQMCSIIDKSRDSVYISFETIQENQSCNGKKCQTALVKLHNNSTCPIIITTASAENFYEPLPLNATWKEKINRRIKGELDDNVVVPEVCYQVQRQGTAQLKVSVDTCGGDVRYTFHINGGNTIIFPIETKYIKRNERIFLSFNYLWEIEGERPRFIKSGDIEHLVHFFVPEEVYKKLAK